MPQSPQSAPLMSVYVCVSCICIHGFLTKERGFQGREDRRRRDMKQQWQEERPDQTEIKAKNIPQINTKHTPLTRSKSHRMPSHLDGD